MSVFYTQIKTIWDEINHASLLPYSTCNKHTCNLTKRILTREKEQRLLQFNYDEVE